jgi:hypothetical protein
MRLSTSSPIKIRPCRSWPSFFTSIYRRSNRNEENSVNENESRSREDENHSYRFDGVTGFGCVCPRRRRTRFTSQDLYNISPQPDGPLHIATNRRLRRVSFRVHRHCVQSQVDVLATNGRARTIADGNTHSNSASRSAHQPMRSIEDHDSARKSTQGRNRHREGRQMRRFNRAKFSA